MTNLITRLCLFPKLFSKMCFVFQYGEIPRISPYAVRTRGNTDQNNS